MKQSVGAILLVIGAALVGLVGWILADLSQALQPFGGIPTSWEFVSNFLQINPHLPIMLVVGLILIAGFIPLIRRSARDGRNR
jgi:hypothetical protein